LLQFTSLQSILALLISSISK